jgi:hypothetical protein
MTAERSFFAELKRRNVIRVATLYLVGALPMGRRQQPLSSRNNRFDIDYDTVIRFCDR